jgi:hypothetical protein
MHLSIMQTFRDSPDQDLLLQSVHQIRPGYFQQKISNERQNSITRDLVRYMVFEDKEHYGIVERPGFRKLMFPLSVWITVFLIEQGLLGSQMKLEMIA